MPTRRAPSAQSPAWEPLLAATVRAIAAGLEAAQDPAYRAQIERLVPGVRTRGVRVPTIRAQAAAFHREQEPTWEDRVALVDALAATRSRDEILFGVFLLAKAGRRVTSVPWRAVVRWLDAVDNWETCDQLAMNVAAPIAATDAARTERLVRLTSSASVWHRRFALATSAALNQGGRAQPETTLAVCARLVADRDPMVCKALAWALREACKHDADGVFDLLVEHRATLSRSALREASEKLTPARKKALFGGAAAAT